jgi:hypothetical protein
MRFGYPSLSRSFSRLSCVLCNSIYHRNFLFGLPSNTLRRVKTMNILIIQGDSKRDFQWYSKCNCGASVTKAFTLKGIQTVHRSTPYTPLRVSVYLTLATVTFGIPLQRSFLKQSALLVEVTLNRSYLR